MDQGFDMDEFDEDFNFGNDSWPMNKQSPGPFGPRGARMHGRVQNAKVSKLGERTFFYLPIGFYQCFHVKYAFYLVIYCVFD